MNSDQPMRMLRHAEEYLASAFADADADPPRRSVAYDNARTAAELAGKAMLLKTTEDYPKKGHSGHNIGGVLQMHGLIPSGLDPKRVAHLLKAHTRADYGFMDPVEQDEMEEALFLAEVLIAEARRILP